MDNPTILLEAYFGPLDGELVKVEPSCHTVHHGLHRYEVERDEDGTRYLAYRGLDTVAA